MTEQAETQEIKDVDIDIVEVERGGRTFKNILPKPTTKSLKQRVKSLQEGESTIITKLFGPIPEEWIRTKNFGDGNTQESAIAKCRYRDEEVSFFLNGRKTINEWNETGGIGDRVRITLNAGNHDKSLGFLTFEVVEDEVQTNE